VPRSGTRWHDLPERYGKYKSVHARFMRWARAGVWERTFADLVADKKNQHLMIDSTIVRAHQQAATDRKRGGSEDKALGRSRGGLSTKVHLLADEAGLPIAFRITAGQAAEFAQAVALLEGRQAEAVIANKGYDSTEIVTTIEALGAVAVIPPRRNWKQPRSYDRALYKQRNFIERCFNRLKQFRRFSKRYCRNIEAFRSCTALACAWISLQLYVDTA
jgi:transposase